jgi:hypothetical protein
MSLSVPDRTLREFNYTGIVRNLDTDVANCTLISTEWVYKQTNVRKTSYQLSGHVKIIRLRIDLSNPIRWEDFSSSNVADCSDQTFYEAVTVATGHVLRNKSEFRTNGYSLGNLLDSLPCPCAQRPESRNARSP